MQTIILLYVCLNKSEKIKPSMPKLVDSLEVFTQTSLFSPLQTTTASCALVMIILLSWDQSWTPQPRDTDSKTKHLQNTVPALERNQHGSLTTSHSSFPCHYLAP